MFDARLRKSVDPIVDRLGRTIAVTGVSANALTITGALLVVPLVAALSFHMWWAALALIAGNRLCDGLDGAVARLRGPTLWGGYLDSLCDYLFYAGVPIGFALAVPANALPGLLLVASFTLTAVSFLATAAIAAGRDMGHAPKAFTYTSGLMEGGETIVFFLVMCLFPSSFPWLAMLFAALCLVTVLQRAAMAWRLTRS